MTHQPSPTNLSDELKSKLTTILTHTWYLHTELRCADKTGKKKEDVLIPGSQFQVVPSNKTLDEAIAAITTAYAEVIRSAVPERIAEDEPHGSLDGMTEAEIFNDAIDTFATNLKNQGLLPNGKDE